MHPFFHNKYYILFAMLIVVAVVVLYLKYHHLYTIFIPSGKSSQTQAPVPTRTVTKAVPSSTISQIFIPPHSQITPAYSNTRNIIIRSTGFDEALVDMTTADRVTFTNEDTITHTLDIDGKKSDVLVNGMTGQRFINPGVYRIIDLISGSLLVLTVSP